MRNEPGMHQRTPQSLTWTALLAALRRGEGETVTMSDGKLSEPAGSVRTRPAAKGTELCLFPGDHASARAELVEQLEALAQRAGRRFATAARVRIGDAHLPIESVGDEEIDGATITVIRARRPKLGYNQSLQAGDSTTLRTKRIKTG